MENNDSNDRDKNTVVSMPIATEHHTEDGVINEVNNEDLGEIKQVIPPTPTQENDVSSDIEVNVVEPQVLVAISVENVPGGSNVDQTVSENSSNKSLGMMLSRQYMDELEDVDSEENFTEEDESSIILFEDTLEQNNVKFMGNNFTDITEDETEDEGIDYDSQRNENFRDGYLLRGKPGKPRNSYSPTTPSQQNSPEKRPKFPTINQQRSKKTRRRSSTFPHMNSQKNK